MMMNFPLKKLRVVLVLAVILAFLIIKVPSAYSAEFSAPEKALTFLTDIVGLDMKKYNVTLAHHSVVCDPDYYGGLPQEHVDYIIKSNGSSIDVSFRFINKTLVVCNLYAYKSSLLYAQPPTNVFDAAKSIIGRYQAYTGNAYIQVMRDMLDTVTELKPMTKSVGNVKLKISENGPYTYIEWIYTSNGLDFNRKSVSLIFQYGTFSSFGDSWSLYKIGSDEINVSEEEAINIARNATKEMPKLYGRVGNETIILQPRVADSPVEATLMTGIREPLTLYPLWHVQLYFDRIYGNYYGVAVDIWADTGEIGGIYGTGIMGYIPSSEKPQQAQTQPPTQNPTQQTSPQEPTPAQTPPPEENPTPNPPQQNPPPTENQTNLNPTTLMVVAAATITTAITTTIIGTTLYKRKRKH
ncbi:MAG: hypothetical protein ACPLKQ_05300 [Candidatus Bathyarchaeales archaeon]